MTPSPSNIIEFTKTPTLTSTETPTYTSTEILLKARVIVENALLRSGPDFSHPIISERLKLRSNLLVTSKTPSEYWFYVITEDGLVGWLFKDWIDLDVPIDLIPIDQFIPTSPIIYTATSEPISTPIPPQENTPALTRPPQYP